LQLASDLEREPSSGTFLLSATPHKQTLHLYTNFDPEAASFEEFSCRCGSKLLSKRKLASRHLPPQSRPSSRRARSPQSTLRPSHPTTPMLTDIPTPHRSEILQRTLHTGSSRKEQCAMAGSDGDLLKQATQAMMSRYEGEKISWLFSLQKGCEASRVYTTGFAESITPAARRHEVLPRSPLHRLCSCSCPLAGAAFKMRSPAHASTSKLTRGLINAAIG
jgi:hypothetical protein